MICQRAQLARMPGSSRTLYQTCGKSSWQGVAWPLKGWVSSPLRVSANRTKRSTGTAQLVEGEGVEAMSRLERGHVSVGVRACACVYVRNGHERGQGWLDLRECRAPCVRGRTCACARTDVSERGAAPGECVVCALGSHGGVSRVCVPGDGSCAQV